MPNKGFIHLYSNFKCIAFAMDDINRAILDFKLYSFNIKIIIIMHVNIHKFRGEHDAYGPILYMMLSGNEEFRSLDRLII